MNYEEGVGTTFQFRRRQFHRRTAVQTSRQTDGAQSAPRPFANNSLRKQSSTPVEFWFHRNASNQGDGTEEHKGLLRPTLCHTHAVAPFVESHCLGTTRTANSRDRTALPGAPLGERTAPAVPSTDSYSEHTPPLRRFTGVAHSGHTDRSGTGRGATERRSQLLSPR